MTRSGIILPAMITYRVHLLLFFALFLGTSTACRQNQTFVSEKDYEELKQKIRDKQQWYKEKYTNAGQKGKDTLVESAQHYLVKTMTEDLIPCWYNTPWEFYGTTETPQKGTIACGYFVTTVIRDAGFNIPRVKWAQLASETFMKKLNPSLKRFHNVPMDTVVAYFKRADEGVFLVGLDNHVGFVVKKSGETRFIHSSYYYPETGVMQEELKGHNPLNDSKYRVFGRILHKEMVINWILNTAYPN